MARPPIPFRNLTQLLAPGAGSLVFDLPDAAQVAVDANYRARLAALGQWGFWTEGAADYRPAQGLRAPQRRAVAFVQAYLAARQTPEANAQRESGLIKMPTGTGKTGIIAAIACAPPGPFKTLVLTPRKALVRQMARDLSIKFWRNLGAAYTADGLQEGLGEPELDEIAKRQKGRGNPIRILNADQYATIWEERERDQQIWVGTFNALHRLLQIEPPAHRDFYGREAQAAAASLANLEPDDDDGDATEEFRALIRSADLVIVDEGHHEPAYSWAQAVRSLGKPTVVLSATPYRNDYKYFELSGRFVFNLSWAEAVDQQLIREVVVQPPSGAGTVQFGPNGRYGAAQFVDELAADLANLPPGKKAIVHAGGLADLKAIQRAFFERTGERTVLIHDRIKGKEKEQPGDLKGPALGALQPLRFAEVYHATGDNGAQAARVWLHQYKLLEGIDDPSFIEIWLYDGFGSARQLIQQIGRAIRRPDLADVAGATAVVRGSGQRLKTIDGASTVAELTQRRWDAYLAFERYAAERPEIAFTAETQLLPLLKRSSPMVQYVAGEFRGAHWLEQIPSMEAFVLPQRSVFTRLLNADPNDAAPISDDFMDTLAESAAEAMQLEDRFDIAPVQPTAPGAPFNDVRMVRYLVWRNSPLLRAHQIPEWRLGVLIMVRAGPYVVMMDTEGNCLDHNRLGLVAPEVTELRRLFAKAADQPNRVRIVETTARGLDVSELGLRSISVRRHALNAGYFDLAEASQTPTSVEGYTPSGEGVARRRLSLARSSVADAANQLVSVHDYAVWAQRLAGVMADAQVVPHDYFNRFAKEVSPLDADAAAPRSILLDVRDLVPEPGSPRDVGWNRTALNAMLAADTCLQVIDDYDEDMDTHRYSFTFDGHKVDISYNFRNAIPASGKYSLSSETLNKELTKKDEEGDEGQAGDDDAAGEAEIDTFGQKLAPSITRLINGEQAFQIITSQDGTIYSHGHFYRPHLGTDLLSLLEGDPKMVPVISEKGDTRLTDAKEWGAKTLFGLVDAWKTAQGLTAGTIGADIAACDTLICDDSTSETADFYGIDTTGRRVFVIHAKADKVLNPTASARKLQEVARQALTSLSLTGSARQSFPRPDTWDEKWSVVLTAAGNTIRTHPARAAG